MNVRINLAPCEAAQFQPDRITGFLNAFIKTYLKLVPPLFGIAQKAWQKG